MRREEREYERRVNQIVRALHEDCILEWKGLAIVDPNRQITFHTDAIHYGQAHNLVRRIWPELDTPRVSRDAAERIGRA